MTLSRHSRLTKSISVMCAIALQFNAFADWRADWKSFAEKTKRSASTAWCETKSSLDSVDKWVSRQCDEVVAGWDGFVENTKQTASAAYEKSINGLNDAKQMLHGSTRSARFKNPHHTVEFYRLIYPKATFVTLSVSDEPQASRLPCAPWLKIPRQFSLYKTQ